MFKWVMAIFSLIFAVIVASVILTVTGVIHPQAAIAEYAHSLEWVAPHFETYKIGQDHHSWLSVQEQELAEAWKVIEQERHLLVVERERLDQLENRLNLDNQRLVDARNHNQNIASLANLYSNMRPEEASAIIKLLNPDLILDVLLAMDGETASLVMADLPPELAAQVSGEFR